VSRAGEHVASRASTPGAGRAFDWGRAFQPTRPEQQMAPPRVPIARRASGAVLHRTLVTGNQFGGWNIDQKNHDAPTAGDQYWSRAKITFFPSPNTVDSTEIGFVQTFRVVDASGGNADARPTFKNRQTKDHTAVDALEKSGWVGYDDKNVPYDAVPPGETQPVPIVAPGKCPVDYKPATTNDAPGWNQPNLKFWLETAAAAKAGKDAGKIYGSLSWGFDVDSKNKLKSHTPTFNTKVGSSFNEAVDAWNKQAAGPQADRQTPDQEKLGPFKNAAQ
jgi:hypothetical protein